MFQRSMLKKHTLYIMLTILLSLTIIFTLRMVDLTCNDFPGTAKMPKTYTEAYDQADDYYSKGEIRGFLYLYIWMPDKTKQCYQLAVNGYSRALSIEPNHRDALTNRAAAYMNLEQYDNAINDYLKVLEINSQDQHARLGIARAYEKSGQLEIAEIKYEEAVQFMKDSAYWTQLHPDSIKEYQTKLESIQETLQQND